jgi:hypothetical protein
MLSKYNMVKILFQIKENKKNLLMEYYDVNWSSQIIHNMKKTIRPLEFSRT